ncbi:MAG: glycosyltransferase family 2 protein [Eubacterium sp.]|jgi:Glycosyltransferases, probably involved in cell wall biogenesis|nr:glycosyltransferase family 2 protein [Eubacterium sp.]
MDSLNNIDYGMVSVIIPVYQAEKYLARCISSVKGQTYKNLEILLVDDGSKDESLSICKELAQKDMRIRVFHHENMGVAATRNRGMDEAQGEFVYFLDSDDWIEKDTLSTMVSSMAEHDTDVCICGFQYVKGGRCEECTFPSYSKIGKSEFMERYFWGLYNNASLFNIGTKLYKRSIIEENNLRFHEEMAVYEDIRFCLEYIDRAEQICLEGKPYYCYFMDNADSALHGYKRDFWSSTSEYCRILTDRFIEQPPSLNKSVLLCLYRAFLQECHNPAMKRGEFCTLLEKYCFPVVRRAGLKGRNISGLSLDQRIFKVLISFENVSVLWLLAMVVSMRKNV